MLSFCKYFGRSRLFLSGCVLGIVLVFSSSAGSATSVQERTEANEAKIMQPEMQTAAPAPPMHKAAPAEKFAQRKKKVPDAIANGWWGPGGYLSITKLLLFVGVFLCWVFTVDWISKDGELLKDEKRLFWNMINFFPFFVLGTIFFNLPVPLPFLFYITFPLTVLTWVVPAIAYVIKRNKPLPPHEKVLTWEHFKFIFGLLLNKIGIKVKLQKKQGYQTGPAIEIEASGKNIEQSVLSGRTILSRNHEGFNDFRKVIFDALKTKADGILLEFDPEKIVVRWQIDGVWQESGALPKERSEPLLAAIKLLIGGSPEERRAKQGGQFVASLGKAKKTKYDANLTIQGGAAGGEKAAINFITQKTTFQSLEEIGMRPEIQDRIRGYLNAPEGLVVFSAMPANGLRSLVHVAAMSVDRFTRDFATVEDVQNPYQFIENVMLNQYDSLKGETPMSILPDVLFREPQTVLIHDLVNLETFELFCREVGNHRLMLTSVRAKDAADALVRLLAMKIEPQLLASSARAIVSQRLIRKLCPDCKEAFEPQPGLLQRLGLPTDRGISLYRAPAPPQPGEKRKECPTCRGIGYHGRTGLFEIIEINDELRKTLVAEPTHEAIRKAANQTGQRGFVYDGALLVSKGITSVEELTRILKT